MSYIGTSINDSATINAKASANIADGSFLAAQLGTTGIAIAGAGANAIGLLPAETGAVAAGDSVTVQIKDIGRWKAGAAFAVGAELSSDANGKAITAVTGKFITAIALEPATAVDQVVKVQICKAGYKA